jgi:hypothetical protein
VNMEYWSSSSNESACCLSPKICPSSTRRPA